MNCPLLEIRLGPTGRGPALPSFTPDHRTLVVPNELSDNVSIVSLTEMRTARVVALRRGSRPWQAKVIPTSGRLALVTNSRFAGSADVSDRSPSIVSVIDIEVGEVVGEISVGAGPNGITVDQLGKFAYVANMRSNAVSVIDIASLSVVDTIPVGLAPAFAKLSRDAAGRILVVTNLEDASVSIIDTSERRVLATIEVGVPGLQDMYPEWGPGDTTGVAISDEGLAFITNYRSHTLAIVDLSDMSVQRMPTPVRFPFFVEIARDEGVVVISSGIEKAFALLDARTREWVGTFRNDGTDVVPERARTLNFWMTDPSNDRLTALLPLGLDGMRANWHRNIVTKFM